MFGLFGSNGFGASQNANANFGGGQTLDQRLGLSGALPTDHTAIGSGLAALTPQAASGQGLLDYYTQLSGNRTDRTNAFQQRPDGRLANNFATLNAYLNGTFFKQGKVPTGANFSNPGEFSSSIFGTPFEDQFDFDNLTAEKLSNALGPNSQQILSDARDWELRDITRNNNSGFELAGLAPAALIAGGFGATVGFGGAVAGAGAGAGVPGAGSKVIATAANAVPGASTGVNIASLNASLGTQAGFGGISTAAGAGQGFSPGFFGSLSKAFDNNPFVKAYNNNPLTKAINSNPLTKGLSQINSALDAASQVGALFSSPGQISQPKTQVVGSSSNAPSAGSTISATSVGGGAGIATRRAENVATSTRRASRELDDGIATSASGLRGKAKTRKKVLLGA